MKKICNHKMYLYIYAILEQVYLKSRVQFVFCSMIQPDLGWYGSNEFQAYNYCVNGIEYINFVFIMPFETKLLVNLFIVQLARSQQSIIQLHNSKINVLCQHHTIDHPFYVAVQYHPEYLSRPLNPSPPYLGLILASSNKLNNYSHEVVMSHHD